MTEYSLAACGLSLGGGSVYHLNAVQESTAFKKKLDILFTIGGGKGGGGERGGGGGGACLESRSYDAMSA